jgi:putative ABC transport system substrate-binding protein
VIEARYTDGKVDAVPGLAAELVALPLDMILTDGNTVIGPAQRATSTIAIVFAQANDPVMDGFVASLGRPGGNLTGLTAQSGQEEAKRLQLLKEVVPGVTRVAVLYPGPNVSRFRQVNSAGPQIGLEVLSMQVDRPDDLDDAMTAAMTWHADGFILISTGFFGTLLPRIVELATQNRWPSVASNPVWASAGGLLSYGANVPDLYRRAAAYADKILKGANPAELPVEQPTFYEYVVNLKTAQAIGVTISPSILQQATEVIE